MNEWTYVSDPYLSELLQVELQRLHIHVKAKSGHGKQDVLPVDGFAFLLMTSLTGFWCDEADELAHAFLYTFFGVFRYLKWGISYMEKKHA